MPIQQQSERKRTHRPTVLRPRLTPPPHCSSATTSRPHKRPDSSPRLVSRSTAHSALRRGPRPLRQRAGRRSMWPRPRSRRRSPTGRGRPLVRAARPRSGGAGWRDIDDTPRQPLLASGRRAAGIRLVDPQPAHQGSGAAAGNPRRVGGGALVLAWLCGEHPDPPAARAPLLSAGSGDQDQGTAAAKSESVHRPADNGQRTTLNIPHNAAYGQPESCLDHGSGMSSKLAF
jgi:hypothetical protein